MSVDEFDPHISAQMQTELARFAGKCRYDAHKKKIIYESDHAAMEAYLTLQREEMERYKWIESEKSHCDRGQQAFSEWVQRYSEKFARYWRKTHVFVPSNSLPTESESQKRLL